MFRVSNRERDEENIEEVLVDYFLDILSSGDLIEMEETWVVVKDNLSNDHKDCVKSNLQWKILQSNN